MAPLDDSVVDRDSPVIEALLESFPVVEQVASQRQRLEKALASANEQIHGLEEEVRNALRLGQYILESKLGRMGEALSCLPRAATTPHRHQAAPHREGR